LAGAILIAPGAAAKERKQGDGSFASFLEKRKQKNRPPASCFPDREGIIAMNNQHRRAIIEDIAVDTMLKGCTDSEAVGMLFWKLASLDPPLSHEEQLLFCAFCRIYQSYLKIKIGSPDRAFEILGISIGELNMSQSRILKEAKMSYWKQYNELAHDLKQLLYHAHEIGKKKKALSYLCNYKGL
jgi:hypothetical protein